MKGIAFTLLNELVETQFGMKAWEDVLKETGDDGIFTAAGSYSDSRIFNLVGGLSKQTGIAADHLIRTFGQFMFGGFVRHYPQFFEGETSPKELLKSVDGIIHVEVKKLFPEAVLPKFDYEDPGEGRLVMIYRSERKLCSLAEGLFNGAAKHFGTAIDHHQTKCVHRGDDHCRFELSFGESNASK